jgi:hypothetical protein
MKKRLLLLILLFGNIALWSQTRHEVELVVGVTKELSLPLISDMDGTNLLALPLSFQFTDKNYLVMMLGNGNPLEKEQSVWLFSSQKNVKWLIANNKNVSATKEFQKRYFDMNVFFNSLPNSVQLFNGYKFDNDYEVISKNPKAVIFQMNKDTKEISLFLTFYVSKPDKKFANMLFTKAKIIEVKLKIKN